MDLHEMLLSSKIASNGGTGGGGSDNVVIVQLSDVTGSLSHTPAEIADMTVAGKMVLCSVTGTRFDCTMDGDKVTAKSSFIQEMNGILSFVILNFDETGVLYASDVYTLTATKM